LPFVNEKKKGSDLSVIHYPKLVHSSPNLWKIKSRRDLLK
jgi:hypothetical protein